MCGISGVFSAGQELDIEAFYSAHSMLRHRGPDDEGFVAIDRSGECRHYAGNRTCVGLADRLPDIRSAKQVVAVLGHHRLSILDTTPAGHQPMNYDGLWMVYNGEVYNYREIRTELIAEGYIFESQSDTEVVLKAYHCWGKSAFRKFNGMWALAILNKRERTLLLSRDRFGVKPLYYARTNAGFYIGSEIKFFRPLIDLYPHEVRMQQYISDCMLDHEVETMLAPVRQIKPAHCAEYCFENQTVRDFSYWKLPLKPLIENEAEAIESFSQLFESAIDLRLRSDVPLGAMLSGGLDSNSIVCNLAHRNCLPEKGMEVFSAVFPDWAESEHVLIWETLNRFPGLKAHTVIPTGERLLEDLPKLLYQVDFPIRSSAVHSQYLLYEYIREKTDIVVLLNGQGADEAFAGYQGHRLPRIAGAIRKLNLRDALSESKALSHLTDRPAPLILVESLLSLLRHYRSLYSKSTEQVKLTDYSSDPLTAVLKYNLMYAALPEYLRYEDRNSMSASCETRLPYLDYRLVELAFQLPDKFKIQQGKTKYIQRKAISGYVPKSIVENRIKKGFVSPQFQWQQSTIASWQRSRIADHKIPFLDPNILSKYDSDPNTSAQRWWRIACLSEWLNVT